MAQAFDRDALLDAFDRIGIAAAQAKTRLQIAVYGGSAKRHPEEGMISAENRKSTFRDHALLASNFRFATEDVDIAEIDKPWPEWLSVVVADIARDRRWSDDWFNDAVTFHLSPLADRTSDHLEFGTFPRDASEPGLIVSVPSTRYLLALKLKAIRILDQKKGDAERLDLINLLKAADVTSIDEVIEILAQYFPASASAPEKLRFLLKNMNWEGGVDAPRYPC